MESAPTWVCNHARFAFPRWLYLLSRFVGEGFIPPAGVCAGARFPGRCKHRPLHWFAVSQGLLFSRLAATFIPVRRGGIYPSRGRLRRRGVRRDEGIPPYGHFIGSAYTGKSACFQRGICGRGMPLPYMPSGNDRPHGKAGCPPGGKPIVGADSISARGVRGGAGFPGRCKHRPLHGFVISQGLLFSRWPRRLSRSVGEGFTAPAGAFRRPTAAQRRLLVRRSLPRAFAPGRGSRDDASIVPYMGL